MDASAISEVMHEMVTIVVAVRGGAERAVSPAAPVVSPLRDSHLRPAHLILLA
jgi:hypothetical protein